MLRQPPRSTLVRSSAASDVYKRQAPSPPGRCHGRSRRAPADPAVRRRTSDGPAGSCRSCLLYTTPTPLDRTRSRMPTSASKKTLNLIIDNLTITSSHI